jgi:hypothetical protein
MVALIARPFALVGNSSQRLSIEPLENVYLLQT